jgi:hypothetical protein
MHTQSGAPRTAVCDSRTVRRPVSRRLPAAPQSFDRAQWPSSSSSLWVCLLIGGTRFAPDSALEGDGFEPPVPLKERHRFSSLPFDVTLPHPQKGMRVRLLVFSPPIKLMELPWPVRLTRLHRQRIVALLSGAATSCGTGNIRKRQRLCLPGLHCPKHRHWRRPDKRSFDKAGLCARSQKPHIARRA